MLHTTKGRWKHKDKRKKNDAKNPRVGKHELHNIMEFAKQAMKSANQAKNKGEELNNFDNLSISTTGMHNEWKAGLGKSKSDKNNKYNSMDLDTKNNHTKFKSLDECLNTSMTSMCTYLKSQPKDRKLYLSP